MKMKSMALIGVALVCGLVASWGITLRGGSGGSAPKVATKKVLVAMNDVSIGDELTAKNVRLEDWPTDKIPEGAITDIESIEGEQAGTRLYKGEFVLQGKLMQATEMLKNVPTGFRVIPLKIAADTVSAFINPGDMVDISVVVLSGRGVQQTMVKTIMTKVIVYAVDNRIERTTDEKERGGVKAVSVLVKPKQAEALQLATEIGKLRILLRSPDDDEEIAQGDGTNQSDLFSGYASSGAMPEPVEPSEEDFEDWAENAQGDELASSEGLRAGAGHEILMFSNEGVIKYRWDGEGTMPKQVPMTEAPTPLYQGASPAALPISFGADNSDFESDTDSFVDDGDMDEADGNDEEANESDEPLAD